jgi:hypothetical protein
VARETRGPDWLLLFVWFVSFIWLNQIDQTDQMNQINLPRGPCLLQKPLPEIVRNGVDFPNDLNYPWASSKTNDFDGIANATGTVQGSQRSLILILYSPHVPLTKLRGVSWS